MYGNVNMFTVKKIVNMHTTKKFEVDNFVTSISVNIPQSTKTDTKEANSLIANFPPTYKEKIQTKTITSEKLQDTPSDHINFVENSSPQKPSGKGEVFEERCTTRLRTCKIISFVILLCVFAAIFIFLAILTEGTLFCSVFVVCAFFGSPLFAGVISHGKDGFDERVEKRVAIDIPQEKMEEFARLKGKFIEEKARYQSRMWQYTDIDGNNELVGKSEEEQTKILTEKLNSIFRDIKLRYKKSICLDDVRYETDERVNSAFKDHPQYKTLAFRRKELNESAKNLYNFIRNIEDNN